MPNVFATPDDCKSELGKKMQQWRADRPDEWIMDEFIREVEKLDAENKSLREHVTRIAEAQADNDWKLMGISIREAAEDIGV